MNRHLTWIFPSIPILAALFLSACASSGKPSVNQVSLAARDSLESGDFQKAIDSFQGPYQQNPSDKRLEAGYARALEDIHLAAETAMAERDYPRAGDIYRVLIQNFPGPGDLAARLSFTKAALEEGLKGCGLASADLQFRRHLENDRFASALGSYASLLKDYPGDADIAAGYARALEDVHLAAEKAMAKRNYPLAGDIYRVLIQSLPGPGHLASRLTFTKAALEGKLKNCRSASVDIQYRRHLRDGSYASALDSFAALLKDYPRHADIAAGYVKAGKEIKDAGDRALAANDFALAGKAYSALQEKYATLMGFQSSVGFSRADLEKGISVCRTTLKNRGFMEYRKGNLDKAIAAWEDLLAFDPENAEIRKAAETAKSQMKRLKK